MAFKIYTKTGDAGKTSLYGGKKLYKSELRIEAYGTIDEANSYLGLIRDFEESDEIKEYLLSIQHDLFIIGSILAANPEKKLKLPKINVEKVEKMEQWIDKLTNDLPPLRYFILPGGHSHVSYCHIARTVTRRAERRIVALHIEDENVDPIILQYMNRLSDFLFVFARYISKSVGSKELPWIPEKE